MKARRGKPGVNLRKIEHIRVIQNDAETDRRRHHFDEIRLVHRALPEVDLESIDTSVQLLGRTLRLPLLISSMTGGDHATLRKINRNLALAAQECGVALGVGSQRVMFSNPRARASFELRQHAPDALLFANLGAVQLNKGFGPAQAREAVDAVGADALYLHLNPLQEAVQPGGDTHFAGLAERIGEVSRKLKVPVAVKEVGSGLSPDDVALLWPRGIRLFDVAGSGGTSWSRIEALRAAPDGRDLGLLFQDWGLPTPEALRALRPWRRRGATLIASGGLRNGIDMAKAVVLGASLCGLAGPFLAPAMRSVKAVVETIERLSREFRTAMFLLGAGTVRGLIGDESRVWKP
jgi:isopentenyl-diphosphate delta-isomerase